MDAGDGSFCPRTFREALDVPFAGRSVRCNYIVLPVFGDLSSPVDVGGDLMSVPVYMKLTCGFTTIGNRKVVSSCCDANGDFVGRF